MAKKRKKDRRFGLVDIIARPVVQLKKSPAPYMLGLLARTRRTPTVVRAPYSCGGENENCYKCYGTGFYDKELTEDAAKSLVASGKKGKPKNGKTSNLGAFASDSRGADY